jgi:hypothetical protein
MLCSMIHDAFCEIRQLAWAGRAEQAADLADAFHNIPKEMHGWGCFTWEGFSTRLGRYARKWGACESASLFDYRAMLDAIVRAG